MTDAVTRKTVVLHGAPFNGDEIEIDPAYSGPHEFYEPADEQEMDRLTEAFPDDEEDKTYVYGGISADKRWGIAVYGRKVDGEWCAEVAEIG